MAQGFARITEGIDPLDERLDVAADDQREDIPPRVGDRDWRLANREKPTIRARFQIRSVTSIVVLVRRNSLA